MDESYEYVRWTPGSPYPRGHFSDVAYHDILRDRALAIISRLHGRLFLSHNCQGCHRHKPFYRGLCSGCYRRNVQERRRIKRVIQDIRAYA